MAEGWQHSGRACTKEKTALEFKFYLHMFYIGNNSLTSSVYAEAVVLDHKGTKEIKLITNSRYGGMSA